MVVICSMRCISSNVFLLVCMIAVLTFLNSECETIGSSQHLIAAEDQVAQYTYDSAYLSNWATAVYDQSSSWTSQQIPNYYKIEVVIDGQQNYISDKIIQKLKISLTKQLGLPSDSVGIGEVQEGRIEAFVLFSVVDTIIFNQLVRNSAFVVLPATLILKMVSLEQLQADMAPVKVMELKAKEPQKLAFAVERLQDDQMWNFFQRHMPSWQLPIIISCSMFALFAIIFLLLFFFYRRDTKKRLDIEEARQVVYQPILKPSVSEADTIQPESRDSYLTETESECTPSPRRSPLRIKAKGLLERRGSNASLTLDLNHSMENINYGTTPKECSVEEYLLSAGNRMTKKQLRNCLKDVKALHREFWDIPMNYPEKVEIPGAGTKNRYKTIMPNEKSRVQLTEESDQLSGYINANYIRGYDGEPKAFIGTQGPMAHTVNDFWKMVWQEKSPIIVMITKLRENNKVKCESYIPESSGVYGEVHVSVVKVIPRDGYTIRELFLKYGDEVHQVLHFWYTAWPDHKTPSTAKQLVALALEVEALRFNNNGDVKGPTIVHCSAGIGRTGCFIATSIGIQQLMEENMADVLGIVCALRLDRGGMVQTAEQYEFVHQALCMFVSSIPNEAGD